MAETLILPATDDRKERYTALLPQVEALVGSESDAIANMANVAAVLRQAFGFFWTGFYRVVSDTLVLGPFQGPLACTRIGFGKGVCGTAWAERKSQLVPDVEAFPGHIACNSSARSEIVVPVFDTAGNVAAVLDIDSDRPDDFTETDIACLEEWMRKIGRRLLQR
ncbi:GAF domain-containing protein [Rikenella microfusus]|uniref:GAF domain-containing protein n=1 Tax=Rikenella microfusus TaxID=28139 RepID=UPI001D9B8E70|nr:GAF domain-containing protein [Rikenella microfusus]HJE88073.1 GAF domain-containing protein [Rikenella microfusus]